MHALLRRQLERLSVEARSLPPARSWPALVDEISRTYAETDQVESLARAARHPRGGPRRHPGHRARPPGAGLQPPLRPHLGHARRAAGGPRRRQAALPRAAPDVPTPTSSSAGCSTSTSTPASPAGRRSGCRRPGARPLFGAGPLGPGRLRAGLVLPGHHRPAVGRGGPARSSTASSRSGWSSAPGPWPRPTPSSTRTCASCATPRTSSCTPGGWRRWGPWPRGWPTRSTTRSPS